MKKLISVVLVLSIISGLFAMCGVTAFAANNILNYISYEINDSEVTITDCDGSISGDVVIPDTIEGYPVTSIGVEAFLWCYFITSITIPDSVTSIDDYAFCQCSSLTSVTLPDSDTTIGNYAFFLCTSLEDITIPDGVTSIGEYTFSQCSSLTSIIIPDGVTSIGNDAFSYCTSLESITIPDGVTSIGEYAFCSCESLASVALPESVTNIGYAAFLHCTSLTSFVVDTTNTCFLSDENGVLFNKSKSKLIQYPAGKTQTEYTIPDGITSIGHGAFCDCKSLTSITIPDSVTNIDTWAFAECSSLTDIRIPDGVTSIAFCAFNKCMALTNVTIPESVTSISSWAFAECSSLTNITIPDSVTNIEEYAFYGCRSLESVTIPNGVSYIGDRTFCNCNALTSITISASVTNIDGYAFGYIYDEDSEIYTLIDGVVIYGFSGSVAEDYANENGIAFVSLGEIAEENNILDYITYEIDEYYEGVVILSCDPSISGDVVIPNTIDGYPVTAISGYAFMFCENIKSITIPASVTSIDTDFIHESTGVENIIVDSNNQYYSSDDNGVLYNKDKTELIQYPLGNSRKEFVIPEGVVTICKDSFLGTVNLESLVVPASAESINEAAFARCYKLDDITFADTENSVTYIGAMAFTQSAIKTIDLPDSVQIIDMTAFANCFALESITIPEGITGIEPSVFMACLSLKEVNIPESVSYISTAFDACPGLDTIIIPENTTNIDNAFITTGNLKNVVIYNADLDLSASNLGFTVVKFEGDFSEYEAAVDGIYDALIEKNEEALDHIFSYIINLEDFEKIEDFTIHGYAGSTAEAYAAEHGFNFVLIDSHNYVDTVITPATYTQAGVGGIVCDHCGDVQSTYEIPMLEIEESEEKVDKDSGVSIVFPEGTFDGEAQIEVTPVEDGEAYYKLISHKEGNYKVTMFDINVTVDGQKVQPNGTVLVQIPLPKGYNQNKCVVYYVADDGTMEELKTYHNKDGYVYFETTHFSYYAILEDATETDNSTKNENELISYLRGLLNKYIAAFLKFIDMIKSLFGMA